LPTITLIAFAVSVISQVGCPIALTLLFRRRTGAHWQVFVYGVVVFSVFQLFSWIPLNTLVNEAYGARFAQGFPAFVWMLARAAGTSLFEEGGRWLGYRFLFPRGGHRLSWQNGIMFGLGHSAVESALLFGGATVVYALSFLLLRRLDLEALLPTTDPGASLPMRDAILGIQNTSWQDPILVAVERIVAIPHQVAWSLLVMESLIYRQKRWLAFALLYHTSVAVIVPGMVRLAGYGAAEAVNLLLAGLSLWIISRIGALSDEVS
jgi:uncharacterized membrane protein YhfC